MTQGAMRVRSSSMLSAGISLSAGAFHLKLAENASEIRAAQHLRYRVFAEEMQARLPLPSLRAQRDEDAFDAWCDHLIVQEKEAGIVGTYRLLPQEKLPAGGAFYSEGEFDLSALRASGLRLLELGRSCVDARFRRGAVIGLLWRGIAAYADQCGAEMIFGCASFPGIEPEAHREALAYLFTHHAAPETIAPAALPHCRVVATGAESADPAVVFQALPALVKGYVRAGGRVGRDAALDRECNTIDVCLLLNRAAVTRAYARRFTGEGG